MKAIMISIKPKYVADILNGKKTIEIRKTLPKCDLPIDVYIYCTKDKKYGYMYNGQNIKEQRVVAKFTLNKADIIKPNEYDYFYPNNKGVNKSLEDLSCLTEKELNDYLCGHYGYAWHIDNLVVFDKPKELSEFWTSNYNKSAMCDNEPQFPCTKCPNTGALYCNCKFLLNGNCSCISLTRAPQSYCFIEV